MPAASPFSARRFLVVFSLAWLILMVDHALLLHWYDLTLNAAIIDSLVSNIFLLGISLLVLNTIRYYLPGREQLMNVLVMCLVLSTIWLFLTRWILTLILDHYENYSTNLDRSLIIRFSIGFLVTGITTMMGINWFTWQEQHQHEERKADAEKLAKEAELFKLRQQLQPHFLFNSLNSINALIGTRPEEARRMVQQLSDFLRGTIKKEETQWVSLQEEVQYLKLYLEIEKVRFGNRLSTLIDIGEGTEQMKLPALLLQPIVENAIKFGLYDTVGETVIELQTRVVDGELQVCASNPFDPETSSPRQGTGFGLKSVQRRLYLLFARSDLLTTETKGNIFITTVRIPQA